MRIEIRKGQGRVLLLNDDEKLSCRVCKTSESKKWYFFNGRTENFILCFRCQPPEQEIRYDSQQWLIDKTIGGENHENS